jgi:hypothetical protein
LIVGIIERAAGYCKGKARCCLTPLGTTRRLAEGSITKGKAGRDIRVMRPIYAAAFLSGRQSMGKQDSFEKPRRDALQQSPQIIS